MGSCGKWISLRRTKLQIAAVLPAVVLIWHVVARLNNRHLEKIAAELASAKEFFGAPGPNHAGTKLFFSQTSESGVTAYLVDIATGQQKFLYEHEQSHLQGVGLLGWSPDDKLFAYSVRAPEGKIVICDGNSGDTVGTVAESKIIAEGTWLSAESLVYLNSDQNFTVVRKANDEWHKGRLFANKPAEEKNPAEAGGKDREDKQKTRRSPSKAKEPIQSLTALSATSVAWKQGGSILGCEIGAEAPAKIWDSTTNTLLSFYFSRQRELFRLHCADKDGELVYTFYPAAIWHTERMTAPERISHDGISATASNLTFIEDGDGYASFVHRQGLDTILIKPGNSPETSLLSWDCVDNFVSTDGHVFVTGSSTNGPLEIWDYEFKSHSLHCAVPAIDHPFRYAGISTPTDHKTTAPSGRQINFRLWSPVTFVPGNRYPLVIGFSGRRWRAQEASVPNAGAFLASFAGNGSEDWPGDTVAVLQALTENPNIDRNRVYLMGVSAGASVSSELLEDRPDLWRGAILLSPVSFPSASHVKASGILMDSGGNDTHLKRVGGVSRLKEFQDTAAKMGIPVTLAIHDGASHVYRSSMAERERIQEVLEFLARN